MAVAGGAGDYRRDCGVHHTLGILDDDPEDVFDTIGFIPFIGFVIWVVATSIGMLMTKSEPLPRRPDAAVVDSPA